MGNLQTLLCAFVLLWAPTGWALSKCSQGEMTRSVTVVYANPGQPVPCEVLYEKPLQQQSMTLWRAENEAGYCEARAAEFVDKLESLGWQCADMSSTAADDAEAAN